jgi:hypothetical protein
MGIPYKTSPRNVMGQKFVNALVPDLAKKLGFKNGKYGQPTLHGFRRHAVTSMDLSNLVLAEAMMMSSHNSAQLFIEYNRTGSESREQKVLALRGHCGGTQATRGRTPMTTTKTTMKLTWNRRRSRKTLNEPSPR